MVRLSLILQSRWAPLLVTTAIVLGVRHSFGSLHLVDPLHSAGTLWPNWSLLAGGIDALAALALGYPAVIGIILGALPLGRPDLMIAALPGGLAAGGAALVALQGYRWAMGPVRFWRAPTPDDVAFFATLYALAFAALWADVAWVKGTPLPVADIAHLGSASLSGTIFTILALNIITSGAAMLIRRI